MRCIDLGCGGGEVTFELARLVGPTGHVTGADMDDVKIALAREAAAKHGLTNAELRVANVNEWDEPAAYDLVYCRFLLEHLSAPVDLMRRMWAAVGPGGTIAVEATDFDGQFSEPPNEAFDLHERLYRGVVERRGGDPTAGRTMFGSFVEAGISRPSVRIVQRVDSEGEAKALCLLTLQTTAQAMLEEGWRPRTSSKRHWQSSRCSSPIPARSSRSRGSSRSGSGATSAPRGTPLAAARRSAARRGRARRTPRTR